MFRERWRTFSDIAWEWLRRNPRYLDAWSNSARSASRRKPHKPEEFGLVAFVDPALRAEIARPIWSAYADSSVIVAEVVDECAPPLEGLDLLAVASLVTLQVADNEDQHLLLSDGCASVRLDVVRGTLLGGPAVLKYHFQGAARLRGRVLALRRLISLVIAGQFARHLCPKEKRAARWIIELRVADALASGATHRAIAQALFGEIARDGDWRHDGESFRSRVQRLVRTTRRRMRDGGHIDFLGHY